MLDDRMLKRRPDWTCEFPLLWESVLAALME